jgi:membrane associated rhomboid family serine protease
MLSDRSYMRGDYPRGTTSALTWVLCATVAGAVLQWTFAQWGQDAFAKAAELTASGLFNGRVWTPFTYVLLHDGLLHLAFNCLGLFFLGREVVPLLGNRRFLQFYLAAALAGAICWLGVALWSGGGALAGASACVSALFIFFACVYPEREITFLLFFVLPVTVRPKILAWCLLGFELLGFVFSEIPGAIFPSAIDHSAHLGGMLAGFLYYRFIYARFGDDGVATSPVIELPAWLRRAKKEAAPSARAVKVNVASGTPRAPANLRAEVDRILDKINSDGFGALTEQEKKILDDAKDLLSRN